MNEGLNGRSSDHRFQNVPDSGVNLLLYEWTSHGLDKLMMDVRRKRSFSIRTIGCLPVSLPLIFFKSFDISYFLSVKEEEVLIARGKVVTYNLNC